MPICSLASAVRRSAAAMSGRRCEQLGGKAGRDWRRRGAERQRRGRQSERGGRLADEDGDGVFKLRARDGDVGGLDLGVLQLGLGLGEVGLGGDAADEAVVGDADGLLILRDGVVEELLLGVGGAELEVVDGELGLQGEQRGLAVGGGGLGLFAGGVDAAADARPRDRPRSSDRAGG